MSIACNALHKEPMLFTIRQECRVFAVIALALLFISQNLGLYMTMAYRLSQPQFALMAAVFYATILICALLLSLLPANGKVFSSLPLILLACTALLFAGHIMAGVGGILAFGLRSVMVGVFWIASLHAFFSLAPPGREGLLLGLAAAAGELIWIVVLPGMNIFSSAADPALSGHLHKIQMAVQCSSGLLLATAFAVRPTQTGDGRPDAAKDDAPPGDAARASVLPMLFAAAAILYIAWGLVSGVALPKLRQSDIPDSAHVLLLLAMPLAGALLDRGGRGCRLLFAILAVLAFAAPAMLFTTESGVAREALYAVICVERQVFALITLLLADCLLRNRKRLPLLLALAYVLPIMSMAGRAIALANAGTALEAGITLGLALAFVFLALRLRDALSSLPSAGDAESPTPKPGLLVAHDPGRLAAFGETYGLSGQEIVVMEMLAQRRSTEDIAKVMKVTESTVRTYVYRLMQKTGARNRAVLMALFAAQGTVAETRESPSVPSQSTAP